MYALILCCIAIVGIDAISLPHYFPKCSRDDPLINECILKASYDLKPYLKKGIVEMDLPSFDKLDIVYDVLKHVSNGSNFDISFKTLTFYNLTEYEITGIEFNPNDILFKVNFQYKLLPYSSHFNMDGDIINIPVHDKAYFEGVVKNVSGFFEITGHLVDTFGIEHCHVKKVKVNLSSTGIHGEMDAIISDDFGLSTDVVNSNTVELGKVTESVFSRIYEKTLSNYFEQLCKDIPYTSLFTKMS